MDKRPHTTYIDYLNAAEMHISACKELRKRLKISDRLYQDYKDKNKIRQELYYLSGYIIECMVSYMLGAILDRLNPDENIHKENILSINKELDTTLGKRNITFNNSFKENEHQLKKKLAYIRQDRVRIHGIPIIDESKSLHNDLKFNENFKALNDKWLPHSRYKLSQDIENILQYDEILYEYIQLTINITNRIIRTYNQRTITRNK